MHVFCLMLMKGGSLPLSFSLFLSLSLARSLSLAHTHTCTHEKMKRMRCCALITAAAFPFDASIFFCQCTETKPCVMGWHTLRTCVSSHFSINPLWQPVAVTGQWAPVAVTKRAKNNTDGWTMGAVVGRDETQPEDWRWGYDTVPFVIPLSYAPKWRNNNLFRFSTRF